MEQTDTRTEDAHLRSAYIWNTAGSMLNAFQSVLMLMVITRACDLTTAGVFTLAYANANLFLTMGSYGMRNFEASDVRPRFGFRAYGRSRVLTGLAMVACSWLWLAWSATANAYPLDKTLAVALMTLMKGADTFEDVFDGNFQQSGRLDVAGKQMTLRVASTIVVFCAIIAITHNLVLATGVGFAWTLGFLLVSLTLIRRRYSLPQIHPEAPEQSALRLLRECLPLFLSAFLLFYVGNAPKYAIDGALSDADQAIYGFIAMPVFVVGLLAQFVYMPMVQPVSAMWDQGNRKGFTGAFMRQVGVILAITTACVIGAAVAGPPVLGMLYHTNLEGWRLELCILVLGGGFLALAQLFTMGITIMRRQHLLTPGYIIVAIAAWAASVPLVGAFGIRGASVCYIACMVVLALWFALLFAWCLRSNASE